MTDPTRWTPTENVMRHTGSPLEPDMDFFAEPPPEIGTVISAESTLMDDEAVRRARARKKALLLWVLIGLACGLLLAFVTELPLLICLLVGVVGGILIALLTTRYFYQCSYVGEQGVALYSLKGDRTAQPQLHIFRYTDGKHLYTQQTRRYKNGVYTGTNYSYRWTRVTGPDFKLENSYHNEKGYPAEDDLWHFASAAERAWSLYLLEAVNHQLNQLGFVEFQLQGTLSAVRIGPGFLEFEEKNGIAQRVEVADMKDIGLGSGVFKFKHKDSTWWSGKGKYSFTYSSIPNAKLFLICLEKLTGIHW